MSQPLPKKTVLISEADLLNSISKKDKKAFDILYTNYADALYGFIISVVKSEELAEELLQAVFSKIWNEIDTYNASKTRFFTWMYIITRNMIYSVPEVRESPLSNSDIAD